MTASDGVIRYELDHRVEALPAELWPLVRVVDEWRWRLWTDGLVGHDGVRYGGVGWGNLSARVDGRRFLVTGSQLGPLERTDERHYALVESCEVRGAKGLVRSRGPVAPSSEAMSHATLYAALDSIRFVFHAHAPLLWRHGARLGLPRTPDSAEYGTVAMAEAVASVARQGGGVGVLIMAGHEDGVLAWGPSADETGEALRAAHRAASRSPS